MDITLTIDSAANHPMAVAVASAWLGVATHIMVKNIDTVGTYKALKRYCKRHFTTILLSALLAFGIGMQTLSGYDPVTQTVFDLAAVAWSKAFIGDSLIEIQRKSKEKRK